MKVLLCLNPPELTGHAWSRVLRDLAACSPASDIGCLFLDSQPWVDSFPQDPSAFYREELATMTTLGKPRARATLFEFEKFRNASEYGSLRFIAMKLLNRKDLTGTFRFLDREAIFQAHVLGALDVLLRRGPELIVFGVTPHEFLPYIVSSVADHLGIETLSFQPSQIAATMLARSSRRGLFVPAGASVGESAVGLELVNQSRVGLASLQGSGQPRYIELQKARDREVKKLSQRFRAVILSVKWLRKLRFPESVDFSGHGNLPIAPAQLIRLLLTRSLQKTLAQAVNRLGDTNSVPSGPFAVFALTYEPEANALPAGLPIDFQGDAVVMARCFLPQGLPLVVKEHTSQQTAALRGFLGRSPLFYTVVESLPNTFFLGTSLRLSKLIEKSAAVFTLTGTVAIEAVSRGIPAVYFGSPWWEGLPGTVRFSAMLEFSDLSELPLPTTEEIEDFFYRLTSERMIPGVATERASTIESRFGSLPAGFWQAEASSIFACIRELAR